MENKRKRTGLYTRVSTGKKEQNGLRMQQKEGIRILKELFEEDVEIKSHVDEGTRTKNNTERNRMLENAKLGEFDAVITYNVKE